MNGHIKTDRSICVCFYTVESYLRSRNNWYWIEGPQQPLDLINSIQKKKTENDHLTGPGPLFDSLTHIIYFAIFFSSPYIYIN